MQAVLGHLRTLTVVKTDLRRFSDHVETLTTEALNAFLHQHREAVGDVLSSHGGRRIKEIGDSYLFVFDSSTKAMSACIALQKHLAQLGEQGHPMEVRIAATAGDVLLQGDDIFGAPVNAVARLEALTPAGEIYFSEAVYQNLNRSEIGSEYVGTFTLKGVSEPVRVYRAVFRHQTRILPDVLTLMTDLKDFVGFANHAAIGDVEAVLDFWSQVHHEMARDHGGVVRVGRADSYSITFPDLGTAVASWHDLRARARRFGGEIAFPYPLRFSAGLALGEVRIFRSAMYGAGIFHSFLCKRFSQVHGGDCLALPASLLDTMDPGLRQDLAVRPLPPPDRDLREKAELADLGEVMGLFAL